MQIVGGRIVFINKITAVTKPTFKGYQHVINNVGDSVYHFNVPFDYNTENCELQIFKLVPTDNYNYRLIETPILKKRNQRKRIRS